MTRYLRIALLFGLAAAPLAVLAAGQTYDLELKGRLSDGYDKAVFKLWVPDEVKQLHAIVLLATPAPLLNESRWQDLADRTESALLYYSTFTSAESRRENIERGRNRAEDHGGQIDDAIEQLALKSGHPELKQAPVALWSYVNFFGPVMTYLDDHADRVIACFASHPVRPGPSMPKLQVLSRKVPCCFVVPGDGVPTWGTEVADYVEDWRKRGAPWCFTTDRNEHPLARQVEPFAIAYLESCLKLRVPSAAGIAGRLQLREVDQTRGWLTERETRKAFPAAGYTKSKDRAGWLPDQANAELWELVEAGKLEVTRDPPPRRRR